MKIMMALPILLSLNTFATETNVSKAELTLGANSELYYSTGSEEMGATLSNIFADYNSNGNASLLDVLGGNKDFSDFNFKVSVKVSSLPFLLEDSTKETLREKVDQTVPRLIDAAMSQNPMFASLPSQMVEGIRSSLIESTSADQYAKIDDRISQVQKETALQELKFESCGDFCVSFGKDKVNSTSETDIGTGALISPDRTKTTGGTSGTGFVKFSKNLRSIQHDFGGATDVRVDIIAFKSRPSFHQAPEYIGKIVNLSEADFSRTKKISNLDSQAVKVVFSDQMSKSVASIFVANHKDSSGIEVTGNIKVAPAGTDASVELTGYYNNDDSNAVRSGMKKGVTLRYNIDRLFTDRLSVGFSVSKYWEQDNPYTSLKESIDTKEFSAGAKYLLYNGKKANAYAKYQFTKSDNDPLTGDGTNNFFGLVGEYKF